jgi:hypothetical protein
MYSGPVIIAKIARQNATLVRLTKYDDVVKTLTTGTGFGDRSILLFPRVDRDLLGSIGAGARLCGLGSYVGQYAALSSKFRELEIV